MDRSRHSRPGSGRRSFLATVTAAGIVGLSGCFDSSDEGVPAEDSDGGSADDGRQPSADPPEIAVETVVDGLVHPWGIEALPDGTLLVTERPGRLNLVGPRQEDTRIVDGTPEVVAAGQGGLLDVTVHPEYPGQSWVYLTYSAADGQSNTATHVGRGRLDREAAEFTTFERLHVAEPFVDSTAHYGSRAVFGDDGLLYVTSGDRQFQNFGPEHVSQDRSNDLGATLRLTPEGEIPEDNPFVNDPDASDAIFSYGHRNPQGMTVHPETGDIWQSEHGQRDGDEINVLQRGGNYGWPVVTYACEYGTDEPVGERPGERDDVVDPVYYWECGSGGFPPSGAEIYDGDAFPALQGNLLAGTLAGQYLGRFSINGTEVEQLEPLLSDQGWRIRAIATDPETGHLLVAVDAQNAPLVRLRPA